MINHFSVVLEKRTKATWNHIEAVAVAFSVSLFVQFCAEFDIVYACHIQILEKTSTFWLSLHFLHDFVRLLVQLAVHCACVRYYFFPRELSVPAPAKRFARRRTQSHRTLHNWWVQRSIKYHKWFDAYQQTLCNSICNYSTAHSMRSHWLHSYISFF